MCRDTLIEDLVFEVLHLRRDAVRLRRLALDVGQGSEVTKRRIRQHPRFRRHRVGAIRRAI